ncbi:MAG: ISAzo13 family transposase [Anaerolinea sp.]|nr:ISAzo13 family transposase [Anaerolinea sp.]
MGVELTEMALREMFATVLPVLDERQRRVLAGAQARVLGRGGIALVARTAKLSRTTVQKAVAEVDAGVDAATLVRRPGAGRKSLVAKDPDLLARLDALVEPTSRGDPMCPLRWTSKSTGNLADALLAAGHPVSPDTVGRLLRAMGYSLQATAKQLEGSQHPDRDAQFVYLSEQVADHLRGGDPVISVDTKKKEVVGQRTNGGREYQPTGRPERVDVHDFPDPAVGKAIPYGVYDIGANEGFVVVGADHDTAAFAAATIGRWWDTLGRATYPAAKRLLVTADAGGSNGYRLRLWKVELGRLAARTDLAITVCHLPPGTSKWNKIEHRLFSAITMNWRGRPLTSHEVVVNLIGATTNRGGLKVHAHRDTGAYPHGIKVTDAELAAVPVTPHTFHGDWNYTVLPNPLPTP